MKIMISMYIDFSMNIMIVNFSKSKTVRRAEDWSQEMRKSFDENPMNLWKRHHVSKFQKLFRIAKRVYCIPASSTSSERVTDFYFICQNL